MASISAIARQIRLARKQLKMNQAQFAQALNASQGSVSKWESGKEVPRLETLEKIASLHPDFTFSEVQTRVVAVQREIMDNITTVPIIGFFMEGDALNLYDRQLQCQFLLPAEWAKQWFEAYLIDARSQAQRNQGETKLVLVARFAENDIVDDVRGGKYLVGLKDDEGDGEEEILFLANLIVGWERSALWPINSWVKRKVMPIPLGEDGRPTVSACRVLGVVVATTAYELQIRADSLEPNEF